MVAFTVNGTAVELDLPGDTPLLFVLRNDLALKAAKLGCGTGHCGACTVQMDGRAVNACTAPLWAVEGKAVRTAEGCGDDALFQAFLELQAAQCGYCIPGILMGMRSFLTEHPGADDAALRAHLAERHMCRCGTHTRILAAIGRARERA